MDNINPEHNHITSKQCDQYCHVTLLTFYEFPSVTSLASHVVFVRNFKEDCLSREISSTSVCQETCHYGILNFYGNSLVAACQFCILSQMNRFHILTRCSFETCFNINTLCPPTFHIQYYIFRHHISRTPYMNRQ